MDPLDFLDAPEGADTTTTAAQPAPTPAPTPSEETPAAGPARGPDGKFVAAAPAAAAADPAAQPAAAPQLASPPAPEPGHVPISALLDEREKRQALERQVADIQRQQQAAQPAPQAPDRFEDPEGYDRFMQSQTDERLYEMRVDMSERFAVSQYGEETVKKAVEWAFQRCGSDPYFNAQVRAAPDPIGFAVLQHRREDMFSTVGDKFDPAQYQAFIAWQAQQAAAPAPDTLQTQQPAIAPAPAIPAVKPPPRSLVHAPQAGGAAGGSVSPEDAFAAAIP